MWKLHFFFWGLQWPAGLLLAPCGKLPRSPPPLLSDLCTCHGWQAERASHSECWNGLWKAAPKPEKEKNGLFLYHQGSNSSYAILGEVVAQLKVLITQLSSSTGSSSLTWPLSLDVYAMRHSETPHLFILSDKLYVESFPLLSPAWISCLSLPRLLFPDLS